MALLQCQLVPHMCDMVEGSHENLIVVVHCRGQTPKISARMIPGRQLQACRNARLTSRHATAAALRLGIPDQQVSQSAVHSAVEALHLVSVVLPTRSCHRAHHAVAEGLTIRGHYRAGAHRVDIAQ